MKRASTLVALAFFCVYGFTQASVKNNEFRAANYPGIASDSKTLVQQERFQNDPDIRYFLQHEISAESNTVMDSTIGQRYNTESDTWYNVYKVVLSYDDLGNNVLSISFQWDPVTEKWKSATKDEQSFNVNGKKELYVSSLWNDTSGLWIYNLKSETNWAPNFLSSQGFSFVWDKTAGKWDSTNRYNATYNDKENITYFIRFLRNQSTGQWINSFKEEYTYDSLGNNIRHCQFYWDVNYNQWDSARKEERVFDSVGAVIRQETFQMDDGMVTFAYRFEYTYDSTGTLKQQLITNNFHLSSDQWTYNRIENYKDNDIAKSCEYRLDKVSKLWIPTLYGVQDNRGNSVIYTSYSIYGSDTVPGSQSLYYYSEHLISNNNELGKEENTFLYPNPTHGYFNIHSDCPVCKTNIMLFDVQGRLITSQIIESHMPVSTEMLQKGVYLYRILENDRIHTGKLIVQ